MNRPAPPVEWTLPVNLATEPDFALGRLKVCPSLCQIGFGATTEAVEPRVMEALVVLAQRKGRAVSRDELVGRCWGGRAVSEDAIQRCIAKVRRLSEIDSRQSFAVETIPKIGYQLVDMSAAADANPQALPQAEQPARTAVPLSRRAWLAVSAGIAALALVAALWLPRSVSPIAQHAPLHDAAIKAAASTVPQGLPVGAVFKDCDDGCPEMVVLPTGYFLMGSAQPPRGAIFSERPNVHDNEGPQHEVMIDHRLAMARYAVTRQDYARFAEETARPDDASCHTLLPSGMFVETVGANWRHPGFAQTPRDPAVCINRTDAEAYVAWLSRKTSKTYRLPSEAEWEYAARGSAVPGQPSLDPCRAFNGAELAYHARFPGDKFSDTDCRDGYATTAPVGSFPANGFGLYDMLGNVAQWTQDCFHETYDGAPIDGSAWQSARCTLAPVRGGSWTSDSHDIRVTQRITGATSDRYSANGFRVVRQL